MVSHRNAGIAAAAIVLVVIVLGFAINVPVSSEAQVLYPFTSVSYDTSWALVHLPSTTTVLYTTSSTTVVAVTQQSTTSSLVWDTGQKTLGCDINNSSVESTSQAAFLSDGMEVTVSWSASDTVDVYVFNSAQYDDYVYHNTTNPNTAGQSNAPAGGTLSFHISGSDTYVLVLHNPHLGSLCVGSKNLGIYSARGAATYQIPLTSYVTQTQTYTTGSETVVTLTLTATFVRSVNVTQTLVSTTTKTCSFPAWNWVFGAKSCP